MSTSTFTTTITDGITDASSIFIGVVPDLILFTVGAGIVFAGVRWVRKAIGANRKSL